MDDLDGGALAARVDALYADVDEAALVSGSGAAASEWQGPGALVYGEVTTPCRIFRALGLCARDDFADLGSGRGQLVMAAVQREAEEAPRSALGVELMPARHACAAAALERCPDEACRRVSFQCADALGVDLSSVTKVLPFRYLHRDLRLI